MRRKPGKRVSTHTASINLLTCASCGSGKYQDQEGQSQCKTCDYECFAGFQHLNCGGNNPGACSRCPKGMFKGNVGTAQCGACAAGQVLVRLAAGPVIIQ